MNDKKDFPREILTEIYHSIRWEGLYNYMWEETGRDLLIINFFHDRTTEIILPSEHHGAVKEGYEWKARLNYLLFIYLFIYLFILLGFVMLVLIRVFIMRYPVMSMIKMSSSYCGDQ